jgi:hypothetical protein
VRRRGHHVDVRHRVRVQAGGDETGDMRRVGHQEGTRFVRDGAQARVVDDARVGACTRDDQARPVLARQLGHRVVVDPLILLGHAVADDPKITAGVIERVSVGQVSAVGQAHAEDRVPRLEERHVHGDVGLRAGVRLDVGVLRPEQLARPLDRQALHSVGVLAAAVIAPPRIPLGVLVGQDRRHRLEHGARGEIFRRDQDEGLVLARHLCVEGRGNFGIHFGERRIHAGHLLL